VSFRASGKFSVGVLAFLAASSAFGANIVQNPGFETGDFSFWATSNWGVTGTGGIGGVFPNSGSFFAETGCVGTTCIAPDSDTSGAAAWLYQDLATVNGGTYSLSFAYASGNAGVGAGSVGSLAFTGVELQVLWGDSATPLVASAPGTCTGGTNCVFDSTDTTNGTNYVVYTVSGLQATSSSTRLEFLGEQDPAQIGLDDVSVNATGVPEPSSFFLLGSGLLGMGALARRKLRS
jgi:hypothetical protein